MFLFIYILPLCLSAGPVRIRVPYNENAVSSKLKHFQVLWMISVIELQTCVSVLVC